MLKTIHEVLSVCLLAWNNNNNFKNKTGNSELHVINFIGTFLSKDPIFHV